MSKKTYIFAIIVSLLPIVLVAEDFKKNDGDEGTKSVFTLELTKISKTEVLAKFKGMTDKAKEMGFNKLKLKGTAVDTNLPTGIHKIKITWSSAVLGSKEIDLTDAFLSSFDAPRMVQQDDEVRALGDPVALMEAYDQLKGKKDKNEEDDIETEDKDDKKSTKGDNNRKSDSGRRDNGATANSGGAVDQKAPSKTGTAIESNFDVVDKPVASVSKTTSEGCDINVDFGQGVAIVQERVVTDGVETTSCEDSLIRYPLKRIYPDCKPIIDIENERVTEQYKLVYFNSKTGGNIEVEGCQPDTDRFQAIVKTKKGCPVTQVEGGFIEQARLIYTVNGVETEVRGCEDGDTVITTFDGCEVTINKEDMLAIAYERVLVNGDVTEDCHKSSTEYNIKQDYTSCERDIDFSSMRVFKQYSLYYTKEDSDVKIEVEGCSRDEDDFETISEVTERCNPREIKDGWRKQARLIYDRNGAEVEVRKCQDIGTLEMYTDTADGCDLNHDFERKRSYVQTKRVYEYEGKTHEVAGCSDSKDFYLHREVTEGCTVREVIEQGKVIQQSKVLITIDGNDSEIRGCNDSDVEYEILYVSEGCSIRHDMKKGLSYGQERAVYNMPSKNGSSLKTIEVQSCNDNKEDVYTHDITTDECDFIIKGRTVTPQNRTIITVEGITLTVTPCVPDENNTIEVDSEYCLSPKFTHDMQTGQSFRNKSYFYMDGRDKVYVSECIKSDEVLQHAEDNNTTDCPQQFNDRGRTSQLYGKTYIDDEGERLYLSTCHKIGNPIPYIHQGDRWRVKDSRSGVRVKVYNDWSDSKTWWRSDFGEPTLWASWKHEWTQPYGSYRSWPCDPYGNCYVGQNYPHITWSSNAKYCLNNLATAPWTVGADTIDSASSDQVPSWPKANVSSCTKSVRSSNGKKVCLEGGVKSFTYTCAAPTCNLTTLEANPIYKRGDGSEFVDKDSSVATKLVCGTGSLLKGKLR